MPIGQQEIPISDQIKEIRGRAKLSRPELAQLLGVSLVAIDQWERSINAPSNKQKQRIAQLLTDVKLGYKIRPPSLVLQNGLFASRGSTRKALVSVQSDLFSEKPEIKVQASLLNPILSLLKSGIFFGEGEKSLQSILQRNSRPARTVKEAVKLDVSAGKNTYTYDAHTYHTKVPPQGIVEFLESYLPEGGVILDPFAGSGMTGVAARVAGMDIILNELSPSACFISHNFTESVSPSAFGIAISGILASLKKIRESLYTTVCRECGKETEILYTLWSYRVLCSHCESEFVLWDHCRQYGHTVREHKILKEFLCPSCGKNLKKRELKRTEAVPVLLGYKCCSKSQIERVLTNNDLERIKKIDSGYLLAEGFYPKTEIPEGVNLNQPKHHGLTTIDRFYTKRNLSAMSHLWKEIHRLNDIKLATMAAFVFTSLYQRVTRLSEFRFWGGSGNTARFNVPFIFNEANVFVTFERKAASIFDHLETTAIRYKGQKLVVCNSATDLSYIPENTIDFIFTDPPFGSNINYSEMNILWESWLGEFTDSANEVIVNRVQGKGITDYENLMAASLSECFRVLRPGHWMLLVFMNSSKNIWDALTSAIQRAGFMMERLDIFDKQHGTFKQFVSENTAGCDLVLHCRKPLNEQEQEKQKKMLSYRDSILAFIENRGQSFPIIAYLHVARKDEPDLRRLYSEWIAFSLPRKHELVDFAKFRGEVIRILAMVSLKVKNDQ